MLIVEFDLQLPTNYVTLPLKSPNLKVFSFVEIVTRNIKTYNPQSSGSQPWWMNYSAIIGYYNFN